VTWNPHKLLAAPQQCSVFLTKHKGVLSECHSAAASYLFQTDKFYDTSLDTGDKHVQCGRRADVLKFWLMWKAKVRHIFFWHPFAFSFELTFYRLIRVIQKIDW
jgi:sulfinoalanine decarboxylase